MALNFKNDLEYGHAGFYPMSHKKIAEICGVTVRTVRRWISGESKPPKSARELIILHHRGRVMPSKWPHGWHFNQGDFLDTGHKKALGWQHIDHYSYSNYLFYEFLNKLPEIEARIDALIKISPSAVVIDLQKYKDEIAAIKKRPYLLPDDLRDLYLNEDINPQKKESHRRFGC